MSLCNCPTEAQLIEAAFAGTELAPTCTIHEAAEIAAAEEAARIGQVLDGAQNLERVLDRVADKFNAETATAAAAVSAAEREARIGQLDPLAADLARLVGAPMTDPAPPATSTPMALNAGTDAFAAALGMTAY